jgi:hypothetical protein
MEKLKELLRVLLGCALGLIICGGLAYLPSASFPEMIGIGAGILLLLHLLSGIGGHPKGDRPTENREDKMTKSSRDDTADSGADRLDE